MASIEKSSVYTERRRRSRKGNNAKKENKGVFNAGNKKLQNVPTKFAFLKRRPSLKLEEMDSR